MEYITLKNTGIKISRIGFGCMSLPDDQQQCDQLLGTAINYGINFFDTADLYGKGENEIRVGKALKERRKEIVLATKVGNQWRQDGSGWDWNPSKAYILRSVEDSLRRLQTDYIDLYQLHGGTINDPVEDTIAAFEQLQREGKIRAYGISSIRPNVINEYVHRSNIVSVMIQYSLLDRRPEESVLEQLRQNQITVLCRGSIAQGLLSGKAAKRYLEHSETDVEKAAAAVSKVSNEQRLASQTCLRYTLTSRGTVNVVGIRTGNQLKEAATVFNTPELSDAELSFLKAEISQNRYKEHRIG